MNLIKSVIVSFFLINSTKIVAQTYHYQNLDEYLNYIENSNLGVGSLSIFKDGKEVYNRSFGQKNIPNIKFNNNTKYQIGSVTKLFTATLIFKLIENNQLKLEDKLSDFYPNLPNAEKITIKNLLEHTSGLGSYVVNNGEVWVTNKATEQEIFDVILNQGVIFQPNEQVKYSNTAYYILTKLLEEKHKKPFHKIIRQEILKPLGLVNTNSVQSKPKNIFLPYKFNNNQWAEFKEEIFFPNVIGVGDMVSTSKDLNVFINNLFNYKILKKETLDQMLPNLNNEDWGRGIAVWEFDDLQFLGHGGDTLGSHTLNLFNNEQNLSIAYNTNGERISKEAFMKYILLSLFNKEFELPIADY